MAENEPTANKPAEETAAPAKPASPEPAPKGPLRLAVEKPVTLTLDEETVVEPAAPEKEEPAPVVEGTVAPEAQEKKGFIGPLRTYRDDIAQMVQKGGASYLSMATAEYAKRRTFGMPVPKAKRNMLLVGSAVLIAGGLVVAGILFFLQPKEETLAPGLPLAPLIFAEERGEVNATNLDRMRLLGSLRNARQLVQQKIGSIAYLYLTKNIAGGKQLMTASEFLRIIEARVPASFLRSLENNFMFGYHEANGNQPFLILNTTSYGEGYAGMLAWEPYLRLDLSPVFTSAAVSGEGTVTSTSTPTTSIGGDRFRDRVIKNKDARILFNPDGSILLLYTLLDQQTIIITTNEVTFNEISARLVTSRNR